MRILFLGGTKFVGRHIAEAALAAGHDVIFANRGESNPALFPNSRHVVLDRHGDAAVLYDLDVDLAIDTSGYTPDSVRNSAAALASRIAKYVFVSSVDAYDLSVPHISETSATKALDANAQTAKLDPELYGAHKARCEQLLVDMLGEKRVLVVRAGLMVGPNDGSGRFTYWPVRVARGGNVLVPECREMPVQIIDVRDVAAWVIGAIAAHTQGAFNLVGTPGALCFGDVLDACEPFAEDPVTYHWASTAFLESHGVGPWVEMPLWLPPDPTLAGLLSVRNDRAWATGLRLRPLAETVRDILAEYASRSDGTLRAGLSAEREAELLEALRAEAEV